MTLTPNSSTRDAAASLPVISSGCWHVDGFGAAAQGPVIIANRTYFVPFWPGRTVDVGGLAMNVGVAFTTPGTIRAGLVSSSASYMPSALIEDYGTVVEATGTKSWANMTVLSRSNSRLRFFAITAQGGVTGSPTWSSRNCSHPLIFDPTVAAVNPNTQRTAYYIDGITGAYPATFAAVDGVVVGPSLAVKLTAV